MSILEELKQKAEAKKRELEQPQNLRGRWTEQDKERVYRRLILPKMQFLLNSFKELIEHLDFLEEPVPVYNYSELYPHFGTLFQRNYKINTDGRMGMADYNRLMQLNINFVCEGDGNFSYILTSKAAIDREHSFLCERGLRFQHKPYRNASSMMFVVERLIPVRFRILVDYDKALLRVTIFNHENFQTVHKKFTPEQLDDELLDSLLCYFMRRDKRFIATDEEIPMEMPAIFDPIGPFAEQQLVISPASPIRPKKAPKISDPIKSLFAKFQR